MSTPASPVRYPDVNSPRTMTKRAWWLIILGMLLPGAAQLLAGNRRLGRFAVTATLVLWLVVIGAVVLYQFARSAFITIATNYFALWGVQAVIVFYAVLWIVLTLDTLRLVRLVKIYPAARGVVAGIAVISLVVIGGVGAYGVMIAGSTRGAVDQVFSGGQIAEPIDGRYNILLLGGDAGPDRDGLRPDSISVVSVEAATGKATIIGLPRNLEDVPFVGGSPLAAEYPNGYGAHGCRVDVCLINSIYTEAETVSPEMYPDAKAAGSRPGVEAMRDAVEGVLGITLQYYVLIDMQGFSSLIDALGGITIESTGRYPLNGNVDANGQPYGVTAWIEPGVQKMDGHTALWYARIRHGTSDYDRMARQRQVQEAILQQFEPGNVLSKFQAVAEAGAQVVSTDIPQSMLGYFVDLASKTRKLPINKLELVPPLVDTASPDFADIRTIVSETLVIATPEPTG